MPEKYYYEADKSQGESHTIPDDEVVISQETVGGIETLTTVSEDDLYVCEECGITYIDQHAYAGHVSSHSNE